jgi:hypothetical protein
MANTLLILSVVWFVVAHLCFGAGEALNHGVWHWVKPKEMPLFIRQGWGVHMKHHKGPSRMEHIEIPAWGHMALLRGILRMSLIGGGPLGTALLCAIVTISWSEAAIAYIVLSTMCASGMASYLAFYAYVHQGTHVQWNRNHPLYAERHMWHHENGFWLDPSGMAILPIYGWAMWLRPVVLWGIRQWKRWEDAHAPPQDTPSASS